MNLLPTELLFELAAQWIDTEDLCLLDTATTNSNARPELLTLMKRISATMITGTDSVMNCAFRNWVVTRGLHPLAWSDVFGVPDGLKVDRVESFAFGGIPISQNLASIQLFDRCEKCNHLILDSETLLAGYSYFELVNNLTHLSVIDETYFTQNSHRFLLTAFDKFSNLRHLRFISNSMFPTNVLEHLLLGNKLNLEFLCRNLGRTITVDLRREEKTLKIVVDDAESCSQQLLNMLTKLSGTNGYLFIDMDTTISIRRSFTIEPYPFTVDLQKECLKFRGEVEGRGWIVKHHQIEKRFSEVGGKNAVFLSVTV